jgi:hypothetical protein
VLGALAAFLRLSAAPGLQDVEEVCAARNAVLAGSEGFSCLSPEEIRATSACPAAADATQMLDVGSNFAQVHGRPSSIYKVKI